MQFGDISPGLLIAGVVGLGLAPFLAVMATSFTKLVVVLSLLRNALGLQQTPPSVVINGLALVLSIYVMYPVMLETTAAVQEAELMQAAEAGKRQFDVETGQYVEPAPKSDLEIMVERFDSGKEPLRNFLIKHSDTAERKFFYDSAKKMLPPERQDDVSPGDFLIALPAFTVTELVEAFQIGFLIFLPFLVIDLIVSNILLALGMMMLPPTIVSLPFKLLVFVLVDGWTKLVHGLVLTY